MTKSKYPDKTLIEALHEKGVDCRCMWQLRGPKQTQIAWIECWLVQQGVVLIETFVDGGWDAFVNGSSVQVDGAVRDVLRRTRRDLPALPGLTAPESEMVGTIRQAMADAQELGVAEERIDALVKNVLEHG